MIISMVCSESSGEPLASETTASKYLQSIAREQEDLAQTGKKSIKRQQRIVSVKELTTQPIHTKVFRVFTRHCCQPSAAVLRSLNSQSVWLKQNGGPQEIPRKMAISRQTIHIHRIQIGPNDALPLLSQAWGRIRFYIGRANGKCQNC